MRLVYTPKARSDLGAIWDYTAARWNADQADAYTRALHETGLALARGDMRGRDLTEVRAGYRIAASGSHALIVRESRTGGALEVVRILHRRMDIGRHL